MSGMGRPEMRRLCLIKLALLRSFGASEGKTVGSSQSALLRSIRALVGKTVFYSKLGLISNKGCEGDNGEPNLFGSHR